MAALQVSVVSAERKLWSGQAQQVVAKTVDGEIGILPGHQPLLALLAPGVVSVTTEEKERVQVKVSDGFFSVDHNEVQVVAGQAELV